MFESFFKPKNRTKNWQRPDDLQLVFDLEAGSLNGVRLGDSLEAVSFLGPVEDRSGLKYQEYNYFSLGLCVCCGDDENTIDGFDVIQKDRWSPQERPYPGQFRYQGANHPIAQLTESNFVNDFGSPYWRDQDKDEIILFYEFPTVEWQVEFNLDGSFNRIIITSSPMFADENSRKAYGVTKHWPPTNADHSEDGRD